MPFGRFLPGVDRNWFWKSILEMAMCVHRSRALSFPAPMIYLRCRISWLLRNVFPRNSYIPDHMWGAWTFFVNGLELKAKTISLTKKKLVFLRPNWFFLQKIFEIWYSAHCAYKIWGPFTAQIRQSRKNVVDHAGHFSAAKNFSPPRDWREKGKHYFLRAQIVFFLRFGAKDYWIINQCHVKNEPKKWFYFIN